MSSHMYDYIHDPVSNKLIKSDSKKGKEIINNYIDEFNGGGIVNTLMEYVSSSNTKPPSSHTDNYGQFLAYVLPEQLDTPILITNKFITFESYIYHKINHDYLFELAQLYKDFVTYILQLKLIHYYENLTLEYKPEEHNEVVRNIFDISDIVHAHTIEYDIFNDTDINSIFTKKYGNSFKTKFKNKKKELSLLNLESNENPQIKLALNGINQIKILMKKSLSGMKQLVKAFEDKYRVQGDQNFSQYEKNHAVRNLEAQKYKEKYPNGGYDTLKFSQEWNKTARDNLKKLVGQNQQPICVKYNKDKKKYNLAVDYKNCFDKVEEFFENIGKEIKKIKKIDKKLNYIDTEQAVYSRKIFKNKNLDHLYR